MIIAPRAVNDILGKMPLDCNQNGIRQKLIFWPFIVLIMILAIEITSFCLLSILEKSIVNYKDMTILKAQIFSASINHETGGIATYNTETREVPMDKNM